MFPDAQHRRLMYAPCGVIALLLAACLAPGDAVGDEAGLFAVRSASTRQVSGVYFANARIEYRLSAEALDALESGVTLTIQLQIELTRMRRFWPDKNVANLKQDYRVSYQPLSERYVIRNMNSGQQASFATLFAAMNYLGRVVDLPIIDVALLEPGAPYRIALRAVLDQNTLPGPLQMLAFWSDGFRLESDWYRWSLSD